MKAFQLVNPNFRFFLITLIAAFSFLNCKREYPLPPTITDFNPKSGEQEGKVNQEIRKVSLD